MRVLIAEDEVEIAKALKILLEKNKFSVDIVHSGNDAWDYIQQIEYNVIVLDIMMPGLDGLEVLRRIRAQKMAVPVLLLTAKAEIEDRVTGLNAGADDYLPKPFASSELIARVKALSRRSMNYSGNVLTVGNVSLDCNCYELSAGNRTVRLNNKEYQVMELFMNHPRHVFSTEHLMEKIWGANSDAGMDVVWTYIGFLRKKLRELDADVEIRTVRGAGYSLEENVC
ncbi:MAG: response regulator transcription factor [Eubacteriales bacterium]|nr:response regulator transcription factor [Eubacteriales bacterium]